MTQTKPKTTQSSALKSAPPVSGLKPTATEREIDNAKLGEFWKEELAALAATRFVSLEAAIDSIVERVGNKIDPTGSDSELRGFLKLVLSSDPSIGSELIKSLRIGG